MNKINYDRFLVRVWDTKEKQMIYPEQEIGHVQTLITVNKVGLIIDSYTHGETEINIIPFGTQYIPMQCTGLRDKNNKLIYQHDILLIYDKYYSEVILKRGWWWSDKENWNYKDSELTAMPAGFGIEQKGGIKPLYRFGTGIEIVGNRFEHPELLKEKEQINNE